MEAGRWPAPRRPPTASHVFSERGRLGRARGHPQRLRRGAILLEHHWAVPLRDAIARAGGLRLSDGFISPLDLVEIGLVSAEEAKELHAHGDRRGRRPLTADRTGPRR